MDLTEVLEQHALWLRTAGSEGARADLSGADLRRADLYGANLCRADLYGANLRGADLRRADLYGANLREADLSGADLSEADLSGADLCRADLIGANLRDSSGLPIATDARHRLGAVAMAALADSDALRMSAWHTCQTTHCIAGWAIHQAGELGRILEALHGADLAGRFLLGHEAALHFHDDDDAAREWLQSVLDAPGGGSMTTLGTWYPPCAGTGTFLCNPPFMTQDITEILQERGKRYGKFMDHAEVTQKLKAIIYDGLQCKSPMAPDQTEALDMICHKIGRIVAGDPDYADSWVDIAGYAKLVADRLQGVKQ